jgi:outer membrane protein
MLRLIIVLSLLTSGFSTLFAQNDVWDLKKCLEYARENNLLIQQAEISVDISEVNLQENQLARLPNLNFNTNFGINFGRTIDPTTNTFDNQRIKYNSLSINAGVPVYSGNRIVNSVKQSKEDLRASRKSKEATILDQLNLISNDYLNVLLAQEQLENLIKARELTDQQLEQTDKLIKAGVLPENDRLDILAQQALNEQNIISGENNVRAALLTLKNRLNLPADFELKIAKPRLDIPSDFNLVQYTFDNVYSNAVQVSPEIQASRAQLNSSELGVSLAKGAMLPTLTVFGNINSNFSDAFRQSTGDVNVFEQTQPVLINGEQGEITFFSPVPVFEDVPYFDQIDQNFGQGIGVNLSVPIFNRFSFRSNVQRSKLNQENAQLQYQQLLQQYQNLTQTTINDLFAARANYESTQLTLEARQAAFVNTEKRFKLGAVNTFDYIAAKNALDQAELNAVQAKYTYIYRIALLKFIAGDWEEPLQFF